METCLAVDSVRRRLLLAGALLVFVLVAGTAALWAIGGGRWSVLDCAYFVTITLTTVGYGETLPVRDDPRAQVLVMGLMIGGIGVVLYFVSTLTAFIIEGDLQNILRRRRMERRIRQLEDHLILCGVGRMGRAAADEFLATEQTFVVLDRDPAALARLEHDHPGAVLYIQGDAVEDEVLLEAGVRRARGLVTSLSSDQDNVYVTISAKALNPELQVVSKAIEATAEHKLRLAGADRVVLVNTIGGLRLASEMIRPEVTSFLDHMLRDHKRTLRVEEIPVNEGSAFVGKQLAESEIRRHAEVLVIAVRDTTGAYHYNPSASYPIAAGETLIVIGNPGQVRTLRAL